jgi:Reverse transcriptase (RNA-dependent DNA polymerase)
MTMLSITAKALLRGDRFASALRLTGKTVELGWIDHRDFHTQPTYCPSPDESFADFHRLQILRDDGRPRLVLPPYLFRNPGREGKRGGNSIYEHARADLSKNYPDWRDLSGPPEWRPDEVIENVHADGRVTFAHTFFSRLLQRLWVLAIQSETEKVFADTSHAYRPGRSRFTALRQARLAVAHGKKVVATLDIRSFFNSVYCPALDYVMRRDLPQVRGWLRRLGLSFLWPIILRKPGNPERKKRPPGFGWHTDPCGHILQGSTVGPVLSNIFANHLLDQPLRRAELAATVIRYSDNLMVMADTAAECAEGVHAVGALLDHGNLRLNEEESRPEPVDVAVHPVEWLGKILHGTAVVTPDHKLRAMAKELASLPIEGAKFKRVAMQVREETSLDRPRRLEAVFGRELKRLSRDHMEAFKLVGGMERKAAHD